MTSELSTLANSCLLISCLQRHPTSDIYTTACLASCRYMPQQRNAMQPPYTVHTAAPLLRVAATAAGQHCRHHAFRAVHSRRQPVATDPAPSSRRIAGHSGAGCARRAHRRSQADGGRKWPVLGRLEHVCGARQPAVRGSKEGSVAGLSYAGQAQGSSNIRKERRT